jgi:ABC-type spermidine/putrescine transport system permease subunit II
MSEVGQRNLKNILRPVVIYRVDWRLEDVHYIAPLFVAEVLIGISTLMFNRTVLGLPGNIPSAILANATYGLAFAFLVVLAKMVRYDWRLDEAAMVFGARPFRTFFEVTLPSI